MAKSWSNSVVFRWTCFVALLLVVVLAAFAGCSYWRSRIILKEQIRTHLESAAKSHRLLFRRYIHQQEDRVALVASRTRLRDLVASYLEKMGQADFVESSRRILVDAKKSSPDFKSISICDLAGVVVTSTDLSMIGKPFVEPNVIAEGSQRAFLSLPRSENGGYYSYLASPAKHPEGGILGVAVVEVRLDDLLGVVHDRTGLGATGEVLVGIRRGERIRYLFPPRHSKDLFTTPAQVPAMDGALSDQSGFLITKDYRDVEILAAYLPVGYRGWGMVVKIDSSEAYKPLATAGYWLMGFGVAALIGGVLGAYLVVVWMVRPIRTLTKAASELSRGRFSTRADVSRSDEIGTLADSFNQMTDDLAKMYATLEKQVVERTRELELTNAALERSNDEMKVFIYAASHDLQAPLRTVSTFLGLLERRYGEQLDEKGLEMIQHTIEASKQMKQLITDLLEFTRVDRAGKPFAPVNLESVLTVVQSNLAAAITESEAEVILGDLPTIQADATQMLQLFQNLVGNALKFCKDRKPVVRVEAERGDEAWVLSVRDNGIGIAPDQFERVFELCQRLHSKTEYPGTGVGLALCKRIVERHGGRIRVESEVGQGTTFFVELPDLPASLGDEETERDGSALAGTDSSE